MFVPFDAGGEVEQSLRAEALSKQPNITVLKDTDLGPDTLIASMQKSQVRSPTNKTTSGFDCAIKTVSIVETMLSERV